MSQSIISSPWFHNEEEAYKYVESIIWPNGSACPHCGGRERIGKMNGKSTRIGVYKCYTCRKPFTVKIGTIFEDSHVPLRLWLQAIYLMSASKKGISSNQLHRTLGVTLKTAWFMSHRIREAMRSDILFPLGKDGGIVEADETFIGREPNSVKKRAYHHKCKVLSLVDRSSGSAHSMVVDKVNAKTLVPILKENIAKEARVMTDDAKQYTRLNRHFASHDAVKHSLGEYVNRINAAIHTNTVEGYFSVFKRGMKGVYQHCAKEHLHRYLAEFDFRYNNRKFKDISDTQRADILLRGIVGKRLTYQRTSEQKQMIH